MNIKEYFGEFLGTFILVFIGCGSVATAVLYLPLALWQIALIWGIGVAIAIHSTHSFSHSHLNPAVTLAMCLAKELPWQKLIPYSFFQVLGAGMAGLVLFYIINGDLTQYEHANNIIRGGSNSYHSAVMFGEFFPNPGFESQHGVPHLKACVLEGLGTLVLVLSIFIYSNSSLISETIKPFLIGLTVSILIIIIAPYTQAGINPARDFGPRLVAYFAGWQDAAFPKISGSFLTVYIIAPLVGATLATKLYET